MQLTDTGPEPYVFNIQRAAVQNDNYRTAIWTGEHLQLTLMSIPVGGEIGLEVHPDTDQFLRVEEGFGTSVMGDSPDNLSFSQDVRPGYAVLIPAGKYHNVVNTGNRPLKLYSIYAPPHHPHGTVHRTKADSDSAENR
jgi:mannose-6-phosphate isomerase-like protein (cupin superfamily)